MSFLAIREHFNPQRASIINMEALFFGSTDPSYNGRYPAQVQPIHRVCLFEIRIASQKGVSKREAQHAD